MDSCSWEIKVVNMPLTLIFKNNDLRIFSGLLIFFIYVHFYWFFFISFL